MTYETTANMKQLFLSHTWQADEKGRNTHVRTKLLSAELRLLGWSTWFDDDDMHKCLDIDASMCHGIEGSSAVICCLTRKYCHKINKAAQTNQRDNCYKEWTYANARSKLLIAVAMEADVLTPCMWPPGVVLLHLGNKLCVDASGSCMVNAAQSINDILHAQRLEPEQSHAAVNTDRSLRRHKRKHREAPPLPDCKKQSCKYMKRLEPRTVQCVWIRTSPRRAGLRPRLHHTTVS